MRLVVIRTHVCVIVKWDFIGALTYESMSRLPRLYRECMEREMNMAELSDAESNFSSSSSSSGVPSSAHSSGQTEGPEEDFQIDSDVREYLS